MKKLISLGVLLLMTIVVLSQSPQRLSYQAIVRNAQGKLVQNTNVGIRFSILQGSTTGTIIYRETFNATTNTNGLVSVAIGAGTPSGSFESINWAQGPYFLQTETDPTGGTNYSITGISQFLSVPYALYSEKANIDGSETKVVAGSNILVTGTGTSGNPYMISTGGSQLNNKITVTTSQTWTVPANITKIKVELWGAAGGGGGSGAYSYSYNLVQGGDGGSGGFAQNIYTVTQNQPFNIMIGVAGVAGMNATRTGSWWWGDTDGGNGGDSWFGDLKAAGGSGGKRGSFAQVPVNGEAGINNLGPVTAHAGISNSTFLDIWQGLQRSYIGDRLLTSKPGIGGVIQSYSTSIPPTSGEGGCAIITLFE